LLAAQARIETALGEIDAMRATVTRLRGQARGNVTLIAQSFMLQGELEASFGNVDEALAAYTAADEASRATPALQQAAALALRSDRPTQARRIYQTLCKRAPGGPACGQEARLTE
jgi:predicted Zn-dependent protease